MDWLAGIALEKLAAAPSGLPMQRASVSALQWQEAAQSAQQHHARLLSLWASQRGEGAVISAAYAQQGGLFCLELPLEAMHDPYPDLSPYFPFAGRMQRAAAELSGCHSFADRRSWLNHGAWPANYFPLQDDDDASLAQDFASLPVRDYPFVTVTGDGVHEIAVGPVHAGIIEPGHFRFSVVGEKVLRLEERLGYTHKGVERLLQNTAPLDGHRIAGRLSGDSTVAFAWAYCMALENVAGQRAPARVQWLRALLLERERVANHLGDLGALANDVAFGFGLAQFLRLKEDWFRLNQRLFGHRLLMDCVKPFAEGVALDARAEALLIAQHQTVREQIKVLRQIFDSHAGLQDRFLGTGRVSPQLANQLGLTGLAGRASGIKHDLRHDFAFAPYEQAGFHIAHSQAGDVAARVQVRFDELLESLRLLDEFVQQLPASQTLPALDLASVEGLGLGWVEGWRGEVLVALELRHGNIARCHCHDPSWQNWPALEHAVIGNIVPDFPLINKSFNLSYSGVDL